MRRTLYLLVVLLIGAALPASAQAHTRIAARLQAPQGSAPPSLIFSVSNLLDDPEWLDALNSAFRLSLHWKVTLYRTALLADRAEPAREWNDFIQKIPTLDVYDYREPVGGRLQSVKFGTLDSLKSLLGLEQLIPTPRNLAQGKWYYTVELTITADDQTDPENAGSQLSWAQRLVLGSGARRAYGPQTTTTFVVH